MSSKEDEIQDKIQDNIGTESFIKGIFRYIILVMLYVIYFLYIHSDSTQFVLFIVVFILNFFTVVFLYKDFLSIDGLEQSIMSSMGNSGSGSMFTKVFVFAILITLILNIATFGIILAVFDYGKRTTNDYLSYRMTPQNDQLLKDFNWWYYVYIMFMGFFAFFVIFSHTTGKLKILLQNMIGVVMTVIILYSASYLCVLSVRFLDNLKHKRQLYQ
jgi:hypothetical protein